MARRFTGASSEFLTFAPGAATALGNGVTTLAVLHKPATNHRGGILRGLDSGGFTGLSLSCFDTDTMFVARSGSTGIGAYGTGSWLLDVIAIASGSATPRRHKFTVGGAWAHANGAGAVSNSTAVPHSSFRVGRSAADEYYNGDIAAIAGFAANMSNDATVEGYGLETNLAAWLALSPLFLWRFNQADVTTAVNDVTRGGANQTARTGTSVVADPPGFSYYLPGIDPPSEVTQYVRVGGSWVPLVGVTP